MKGYACDLAVRIDGKPYFVDGTSMTHMAMHMQKMVLRRYKKRS
jgi:restriction endonuclease Mrr